MCKRKFLYDYVVYLLIAVAICLSSVCFCGFKANPPQGGGGSVPRTPQTCEEMFKDKTMNLSLSSVNLKYDLTNCVFGDAVWHELMEYHYEIMEKKGSIKYLSTILNRRDDMADEARKPSIKATLSSSICYNGITKTFEPDEVIGLLIKNVPAFGVHLEKLVLSIKTIKTIANEAQLCWEANIPVKNMADIRIDADSKLNCECSWFSYLKTIIGGNRIGVREIRSGEKVFYKEIENTGMALKTCDDVEYKIAEDVLDVSPILKRPIYTEGRVADDVRWEVPMLVEIN